MKKILLLSLVLFSCTSSKTKIIERQKEILKEKNIISQKLESTKDSAYPTPAQFQEWDSLNAAAAALDKENDSLEKELKKY